MNPIGQVPMIDIPVRSSSYSSSWSSDVPHAMEALQGLSPAPFLHKTCELVDDPNTNHIVSWSRGNNSFVIWDPEAFAAVLLPNYFKHSNLSSFIRQLNTYGFRKVDPDKLEFASEWFLRGQRHLLKNIKRRKPPSSQPQDPQQVSDASCVEIGQFGPETEIDRLRRDKQVLMVELVKLRQEQQNTKAHLKTIENRLEGAEMKQQQVTSFLAKMIQNPNLFQQLVQNDSRRKLEDAISKKRRREIDQGLNNGEVVELGQVEGGNDVRLESRSCNPITFSEPRTLSMDIQVPSGTSEARDERQNKVYKSLDKGFWEELLNDGVEEHNGLFGSEAEEQNADIFDEHFGFSGF